MIFKLHINKIVYTHKSMLRIWLLLFCGIHLFTHAQDLHYTQFYNAPINLNPALTGNEADYRLILNTRSQWKSVTVPYRTYSAGFDMRAFGIGTFHPNTGVGITVNSDIDGDANLRTTNFNFTSSYHHVIDADSVNTISAGILLGYTQKSFNIDALTFNNQFNGDLFDPTAPTGEPVSNDKMGYFDLGIGMHAKLLNNNKRQAQIGFAIQHINQAKNSFYNSGDVKIKPRITSYLQWMQRFDSKVLIPYLLYMHQNTLQQIQIGGRMQWIKTENIKIIETGASCRWNDAITIQAGIGFKNLNVGLSYDINISKLRSASNGRGAFEASIIYRMFKIRPLAPSPPCIIF